MYIKIKITINIMSTIKCDLFNTSLKCAHSRPRRLGAARGFFGPESLPLNYRNSITGIVYHQVLYNIIYNTYHIIYHIYNIVYRSYHVFYNIYYLLISCDFLLFPFACSVSALYSCSFQSSGGAGELTQQVPSVSEVHVGHVLGPLERKSCPPHRRKVDFRDLLSLLFHFISCYFIACFIDTTPRCDV